MTDFESNASIPPLQELHCNARSAYRARDLAAYMGLFSTDLRYHQADGRTISRDQLGNDVAAQFRSVSALDADYRTDTIDASSDGIMETVTQQACIATTAFGLLHRIWRLERRSRYNWREMEGRWQISEVTVLHERVISHGFQFGWKPRLPVLSFIESAPDDYNSRD